jgi:hypothetical protein
LEHSRIVEMKRAMVVLFLLMNLAVSGQEVAIDSYREDEVDFRKYRTYFWASQAVSQQDEGSYFLKDLVLKSDIRDAVYGELEGRGYRMNESDPDLLVNFRVFEKRGTLKGTEGYGPAYWGKNEFISNDAGADEIKVEAGTLIISLLETDSGKVVWQGFASGLIDKDEFIRNEGKIREAVSLIFEEYGNRVGEYTRR